MGGSRIGRGRMRDDAWWTVGYHTVGWAFRACFRLRVHHLDRVPLEGSALIACNHISVLDSVALGIAVSWVGRTVRFLAAAEAFNTPVIGWGLRAVRQIPIKRGASDWAALEEAAAVIRDGALAGIFPEGRVADEAGLPERGRKGVARLALAAGVPVVPVAVWGTQVRWPKTGFTLEGPIRPVVAVVIGEPIAVEGEARDPRAVAGLTERIMGDIRELLEEARALAPYEPA
ncbi:MAG: 1-acyl-sn-glycerol-3-phosphate acyltransferase [Actinobacteria bacterium]|nr:1-acyl-sn-glycerol-3-phosphate acyltransferase [Actinomycetota bacterium]